MDEDDLEPQHPKRKRVFTQLPVEPLSIEELQRYIEFLHVEIERARTEIQAKQSLRGDAEALFRK